MAGCRQHIDGAITILNIGDEDALTPAAVRLIIKGTARRASDEHLVNLFGADLDVAIAALSTDSLHVGLTQGLFASGEDRRADRPGLALDLHRDRRRYGRKLAPSSNAAARMLREVRG